MNTVFDFTVKDRKGNNVALNSYQDEVLLIVNTATQCPATPQYADLEALYEAYHSQGFAILDFPSNQPTKSCPGKDDMVHQFVKDNYSTEFPRFKKIKPNITPMPIAADNAVALTRSITVFVKSIL